LYVLYVVAFIKDGGRTIAWKVFEAKAQGGRPVGRP
jgi:hypothetical protein